MQSSVKLQPVTSAAIDSVWLEVVPFIEEALLAGGDADVGTEDVHNDLLNSNRQLWTAVDEGKIIAAAVTQIIVFPRNKIGQVTLGAGIRMEEWMHYMQVFEQWFKSMGCTRVELLGRPGWSRVFKQHGFVPESLVVRKRI